MVLILPKRQTFGERLGTGIGAGFSTGVAQASKMKQELALEKAKREQLLKGAQEFDQLQRSQGSELMGEEGNEPQEGTFAKAKYFALMGHPELARVETAEQKLKSQHEMSRSERHEKRAEDYLTEARKSKQELNAQMTSLDAAMQAIHEGKDLTGDWWADVLHLPQLKSAPGAVIDAAAKTHMLSAITNLNGGRPNMFLEKQVSQAFAMPGASPEANMAKLEILKTIARMKEIEVNKALEIGDRYEDAGKRLPGKLDRLALKEAEPAIQKAQKTLSYKLQDLMEPKEGSEELEIIDKVPKGTPLTRKKASVIFRQANPGADQESATEEQINRAIKLAEGLGYNVNILDEIEE